MKYKAYNLMYNVAKVKTKLQYCYYSFQYVCVLATNVPLSYVLKISTNIYMYIYMHVKERST